MVTVQVDSYYTLCNSNPNHDSNTNLSVLWRYALVRHSELCEISAIENLCCRKTGPKFTKLPWDLHQCPSLWQISSRSTKRCARKAFVYIIQYFGAPGVTLGQSSLISTLVQQGSLYHLAKFRPLVTTCTIYLLPNFVDFVESVTDITTTTVNDVSPHIMSRQKTTNDDSQSASAT